MTNSNIQSLKEPPSSFATHSEDGRLLCHYCEMRETRNGVEVCTEEGKRVEMTTPCIYGCTVPTRKMIEDGILKMDKILREANTPYMEDLSDVMEKDELLGDY